MRGQAQVQAREPAQVREREPARVQAPVQVPGPGAGAGAGAGQEPAQEPDSVQARCRCGCGCGCRGRGLDGRRRGGDLRTKALPGRLRDPRRRVGACAVLVLQIPVRPGPVPGRGARGARRSGHDERGARDSDRLLHPTTSYSETRRPRERAPIPIGKPRSIRDVSVEHPSPHRQQRRSASRTEIKPPLIMAARLAGRNRPEWPKSSCMRGLRSGSAMSRGRPRCLAVELLRRRETLLRATLSRSRDRHRGDSRPARPRCAVPAAGGALARPRRRDGRLPSRLRRGDRGDRGRRSRRRLSCSTG